MNKKEIKKHIERMYDLGTKLTGEDKETYAWLIHVFNQCAELLNEMEQQCKKQKEVIDKANNWVRSYMDEWSINDEVWQELNELLILLEEVE